MASLVFICTGNVCRSPFAERLTRQFISEQTVEGWQVSSLGTNAMSGHPMDSLMAAQLAARGASSAGFHARQASFDRLEEADLILAMAASHRDWVLEESPSLLTRTFTLGQAVKFAREQAGQARGEEFFAQLRRHRSRARRRDDVPDPYRRGEEAAAHAATTIAALLDDLLPRLMPAL